jgi:sulfite dehydrogenase (cytochrome) subunit B
MKRALLLGTLALTLALPAAASAAEKSITLPPDNSYGALKPGPGMELARANCLICHATDYIVMQPRGDVKQWQGVVTKMMKVFGAPISPEDEKAIVDYLTSAYGPLK